MARRHRPALITGPFRGADALAEGVLTRAQLRGPTVTRLFQGVYVPSATAVDHVVRARAATLLVPGDTVITGRSALAVHGASVAGPLELVEVVVAHGSGLRPARGLHVIRADVAPDEWTTWESARLATPYRAALDLCRGRRLADVVADLDVLARTGAFTADGWRRWLVGRHDKGIVIARRAAQLVDVRAESPPESRVRVHLVEAGLAPVPQLPVVVSGGRLLRVDLGFECERVAVEYDGAWHALREQLQRDRERLNLLREAGWLVVHVTAADLAHPAALVARVRAALVARP